LAPTEVCMLYVESIERLYHGQVRPMVGGHARCLGGAPCECAIAREICAAESIDALLWVADHQKRR